MLKQERIEQNRMLFFVEFDILQKRILEKIFIQKCICVDIRIIIIKNISIEIFMIDSFICINILSLRWSRDSWSLFSRIDDSHIWIGILYFLVYQPGIFF